MADTRLPAMPPLADGASEVLSAISAALSAPALRQHQLYVCQEQFIAAVLSFGTWLYKLPDIVQHSPSAIIQGAHAVPDFLHKVQGMQQRDGNAVPWLEILSGRGIAAAAPSAESPATLEAALLSMP